MYIRSIGFSWSPSHSLLIITDNISEDFCYKQEVKYTFQNALIGGVSFSSEMSSSKIHSKLILYKCWLQPGGFKSISTHLLPLFT